MRSVKSQAMTNQNMDPLAEIFEDHLFNFQDPDADRKTFVSNIVQEYLNFLRKQNMTVPVEVEESVTEELEYHVNTMLVKKIYGNLTIKDFRQQFVSGQIPMIASRADLQKTANSVPSKPSGRVLKLHAGSKGRSQAKSSNADVQMNAAKTGKVLTKLKKKKIGPSAGVGKRLRKAA